ncbi:MAG: hypothetical protein JXB50_11855 [Spirochaetes bacterium]|nr:hypothetical protein [Spirochaetota bacterium]
MILFTIKKTFFDMWDNLFHVIVLNFILLLLIASCVYLPVLLSFNIFMFIMGILLSFGMTFVFAGAGFLFALEIANNNSPGFVDFLNIMKKSWKISLAFFILFGLFLMLSRFSVSYYYSQASTGTAGYVFKGETGYYNIKVKYFDKKNYSSSYELYINNEKKHSWKAEISKFSDNFWLENIKNIRLKDNDRIIIKGVFEGRDLAIIDYIIIEDSAELNKKYSLTVEAEDMILDNYKIVDYKDSSNNKIVSLTLTIKGIIGLSAATFLFIISLIIVLSMQFFFPVYGFLNKSFYKTIKTCFIIFFDNTFFSIAMFLGIAVIFFISVFCAYLLPGIMSIFLWLNVGMKLRLYKYDYLEINKEASRKNIPWEELIAKDREILGRRTLKGLIFPWKD